MRNDNAGLCILDQKFREMRDASFVEVVGRLVEEEQVWVLDECVGQEQPRLLPTREGAHHLVVVGVEVDHLEHAVDARVDVIYLFGECGLEEVAHRKLELCARDHLARNSDGEPVRFVDDSFVGLTLARDERKEGALASAILAHDGEFGATAHDNVPLTQNGALDTIRKRYLFKPKDSFLF